MKRRRPTKASQILSDPVIVPAPSNASEIQLQLFA
jgi:hypothetical protein